MSPVIPNSFDHVTSHTWQCWGCHQSYLTMLMMSPVKPDNADDVTSHTWQCHRRKYLTMLTINLMMLMMWTPLFNLADDVNTILDNADGITTLPDIADDAITLSDGCDNYLTMLITSPIPYLMILIIDNGDDVTPFLTMQCQWYNYPA